MNHGAIVLKGGGTLRTTGGTDIYNNGSISGLAEQAKRS